MHWIFQHKDEIQALTNVVIAVLTVVLIFLTAVYSHANRRTMNRAAVRFLKWHRYRKTGDTRNQVVEDW